ncbi:MAG: hypothetical protein R3B51_04575 [Thermodesulfobacteriota bacterium]
MGDIARELKTRSVFLRGELPVAENILISPADYEEFGIRELHRDIYQKLYTPAFVNVPGIADYILVES